MSQIDREYHELCRTILRDGYEYIDESRGIICKQISSYTLTVDKVFTQFPLITTKKMFTKGIVGELIWFLRGNNNIKYLVENNINIWNKDGYNWYKKEYEKIGYPSQNLQDYEDWLSYVKSGERPHNTTQFNIAGDVGRNYGVQWRDWTKGTDQISNLLINLRNKPMGRRHIVTAWNPAELDQTALPPCHWAFEIIPYPITDEYKHLLPGYEYFFDLKWHQRSVDTFLG